MTKPTPPSLPYLSDYARGKLLTKAGIKNAAGLKYHRLRNLKPNNDPNNLAQIRTTTKRPVKCIQTGEVFESIHACARAHDLTPSNLCAHLKGKLPAVKNRQYKYTTDNQLRLHQKRNKTPANTAQQHTATT